MIETTLDEANKLLSFIKQKIELNKPLIEDSSPDNYTPVIDTLAISVRLNFHGHLALNRKRLLVIQSSQQQLRIQLVNIMISNFIINFQFLSDNYFYFD